MLLFLSVIDDETKSILLNGKIISKENKRLSSGFLGNYIFLPPKNTVRKDEYGIRAKE